MGAFQWMVRGQLAIRRERYFSCQPPHHKKKAIPDQAQVITITILEMQLGNVFITLESAQIYLRHIKQWPS